MTIRTVCFAEHSSAIRRYTHDYLRCDPDRNHVCVTDQHKEFIKMSTRGARADVAAQTMEILKFGKHPLDQAEISQFLGISIGLG
jgi:hypothetical protein